MALLFCEGFEKYSAQAQLSRGGWSTSSTLIGIVQTGRQGAGSQSVSLELTGGTLGRGMPGGAIATFIVGFAYQLVDSGPQNTDIFKMMDAGSEQLVLRTTSGGELAIDRGSTQLEITSGLGLAQGNWYYIEVKATINNSTGAYDVEVDGVSQLSDSSIDTQQTANATVDEFQWIGHATPDPEIDDVYISDTTGGAPNNDFLGPIRVETVFPDANGDTNNFTASPAVSNYLNVDDGLTPDDDTSYNTSSTAAHEDLYGFAALSGDVDTVYGVQASMLTRKEDAGSRTLRAIARNNVTTVDGPDQTTDIEYKYVVGMFETDPDGAGAWTEADVNSAQFGITIQT